MDSESATLSVVNTRSAPVTFHLEPYGASTQMPPGVTWTVSAALPPGDHLTVEMVEGAIVVHAGDSLYTPVTVSHGAETVIDCRPPEAALFDPYRR